MKNRTKGKSIPRSFGGKNMPNTPASLVGPGYKPLTDMRQNKSDSKHCLGAGNKDIERKT